MAAFKPYFDNFLIPWEGDTYENVPGDSGGPTKYGITLEDWQTYGYDINGDGVIDATDVSLISYDGALVAIKKEYWDKCCGDAINNQSVAEAIVDFAYNCGMSMVKKAQAIVGADPDGAIGNQTVTLINAYADQHDLFDKIQQARIARYDTIVANNPSQQKFYKGWINRTNNLQFSA